MNWEKMKTRSVPVLFTLGAVAMVVGAADPLEGSVVILAGSLLVTLSRWFRSGGRALAVYWSWLSGSIVAGVVALFVLSAFGGIGGPHGHSPWWGLLLVPYPLGWILGMANLISRGIERALRFAAHDPG